jgi:hypothetical protein
MTELSNNDTPRHSTRGRAQRPERIDIIDDELVRNDVLASELRVSERTLNRGDAHGAPFTHVGGVKYRPYKRYKQYMAGRIKPEPPRRQRAQ